MPAQYRTDQVELVVESARTVWGEKNGGAP